MVSELLTFIDLRKGAKEWPIKQELEFILNVLLQDKA